MKGTVLKCIKELVTENFGEDKWIAVVTKSDYPTNAPILATADIPDEQIYSVIGCLTEVLGITQQQAFDAFGDYWMNNYGKRIYSRYYGNAANSREFLLGLNKLHDQVTRDIPNAKPPRFTYDWKDNDTLVMTYMSERGLIDLMISMTKAVGAHFGETLDVNKVGDDQIEIGFPPVTATRSTGTATEASL